MGEPLRIQPTPQQQTDPTEAPRVDAEGKRLNATERDLLAFVRAYSQQNGWAWPSREYIAKTLGITPRHVTRLIKDLTDRGLLRLKSREGKTNLLAPAPWTFVSTPLDKNVHPGVDKNVHQYLSPKREQGGGRRRRPATRRRPSAADDQSPVPPLFARRTPFNPWNVATGRGSWADRLREAFARGYFKFGSFNGAERLVLRMSARDGGAWFFLAVEGNACAEQGTFVPTGQLGSLELWS